MSELQQEFDKISGLLRNPPAGFTPADNSIEMKLKLYALYKQATEGDVAGERPGALDMAARLKYDACAQLKGMSRHDAMLAYIKAAKATGIAEAPAQHGQPWWRQLPQELARTPVSTALDSKHQLKIKSAAAFDVVLRTAVTTLLMVSMASRIASPRRFQRNLALMEFYKARADRASVADVFVEPPRHVKVTTLPRQAFDFQPSGINTELLTFESPYVTLHPDVRSDYDAHPRNRHATAQYWRHPQGPRPTLIFIHGYGANNYLFNSLMFSLRWFYKQGYDVLLYTLPFHGTRSSKYDLFSGFGYFGNGFAHLNEATLQAIYDLRIWINYLQDQGAPAVGVSGLSLGGYVASLAAAVDSRLAFVIPNAPPALMADLLVEWQPLAWAARRLLPKYHLDIRDIRHFLALHSPLTYPPVVAADRLLIIGGAGDRLAAPHHAKTLHDHWKGSRLHWFPGNHMIHVHQATYLRLMKEFMDDCCRRKIAENAAPAEPRQKMESIN
jgi:acyl-CoA-binding protein/pimeloyl-ACP methyl ester carboxylesterase